MTANNISFWRRFSKSTGFLGGLAVVLVIFASRAGGGFDWKVFLLSGLALLIAWSQSWLLVPLHLRHKEAETQEWNRFFESDWRFVDAISGLNGTELDALRDVFRKGQDAAARAAIELHFPAFEGAEVQAFLVFFNDTFMDTVSAYIDEDGRLQPID